MNPANPDSGKSGSKANSDIVVQDTCNSSCRPQKQMLICSLIVLKKQPKLYQALEINGNVHKVYYKDPRLLFVDEMAARKLLESEFPGDDIEQILQEEKLYLSPSKTEKSKVGRKGRRKRTPNVSMKGVIIPENDRPNTRARSKLPSIPEGDKGKKVLEGPSEVNELSNPKIDEFFPEQVTSDVNLAIIIEEDEEEEEKEEVTDLILRDRKKNTESKVIEVITPVKKKNSEASEYVVHASQTEKEYFDKIKRAGNIFMKDVSKGEMVAIK